MPSRVVSIAINNIEVLPAAQIAFVMRSCCEAPEGTPNACRLGCHRSDRLPSRTTQTAESAWTRNGSRPTGLAPSQTCQGCALLGRASRAQIHGPDCNAHGAAPAQIDTSTVQEGFWTNTLSCCLAIPFIIQCRECGLKHSHARSSVCLAMMSSFSTARQLALKIVQLQSGKG